ncbi:DUF4129 domain-containing protein [Candidatus Bipolaricaulota bacterium]|nr:DUF4129 domain-containing protein [Candidatus Bipolaricaulota bacterium]
MSATRTRQTRLVLCRLVLIAVMFALIGGLHTVEFHSGKPFPSSAVVVGPSPPAEEHTPIDLWNAEALYYAIPLLIILGLALLVILTIISPQFRLILLSLHILYVYFVIGATLIVLILLAINQRRLLVPPHSSPLQVAVSIGPAPLQVERLPMHAPEWGVIMAAIGVALFVTGSGLFFVLRRYPLSKKQRKERNLLLEQLGELASDAATRIRAGADPREVVLYCYKEMSDMLSRAEKTPNFSHFTPREFAQSLRARGMSDAHIDRLTGIFEQVRYGGRQGKEFADKALLSLEAIERTYARGEAA